VWRTSIWLTTFVAAGLLEFGATRDLTSVDANLRDGFKSAFAEARPSFGEAGESHSETVSDAGNVARIWLGAHEASQSLRGRSFQVGERIVIGSGSDRLSTFDVKSITALDRSILTTTQPAMLVVLQPAFEPDAPPVRLIVEGDPVSETNQSGAHSQRAL